MQFEISCLLHTDRKFSIKMCKSCTMDSHIKSNNSLCIDKYSLSFVLSNMFHFMYKINIECFLNKLIFISSLLRIHRVCSARASSPRYGLSNHNSRSPERVHFRHCASSGSEIPANHHPPRTPSRQGYQANLPHRKWTRPSLHRTYTGLVYN